MPVGSPQLVTQLRRLPTSSQTSPFGGTHKSFATSDNKIILFYEGDTNFPQGVVVRYDGTAADQPSPIDFSVVGSPARNDFSNIDEEPERFIQLTDERFVRLVVNENATAGSPFLDETEIQLINVDATTGAATSVDIFPLSGIIDGSSLELINRKGLFKISDTRFGVMFTDLGINTPSVTHGALYLLILDDAGASITTQLSKTLIADITGATYNRGDANSFIDQEMGIEYLTADRIVSFAYTQNSNGSGDHIVLNFKLNATFTGIEQTGPAVEVLAEGTSWGSWSSLKIAAIDANHILWTDEFRNNPNTGNPYIIGMYEVNTTTLATTVGEIVLWNTGTGSPNPFGLDGVMGSPLSLTTGDTWDVDRDHRILVDGTTAYVACGLERRHNQINSGTLTVNAEPFDGILDMGSDDRFVDTHDNLATAYPSPFVSQKVMAKDTGLMWTYAGAGSPSWTLPTTNASSIRDNGLAVFVFDLDTAANTVRLSNFEFITTELNPRWDTSGSPVLQRAWDNAQFETDSNNIIKLPNGRLVLTCEAQIRHDPLAPFLTAAEEAASSNLYIGGDFLGLYFDPANIP